jgi:hypothetical protein
VAVRGEPSSGDVEILYVRVPGHLRGAVLLCLHHWTGVLRKCIRHFWKVDSRVILKAPGFSLERAREMFRRAQFPLPPDIAPVLQVWRGTTGRTLEQAREGLCWTLDRDAACWFATLYEGREHGDPLVVTTSIRSDQILFFDQDEGLHEKEVVLDRLFDAEIDAGGEAEWRERGRRYIETRKQAGW